MMTTWEMAHPWALIGLAVVPLWWVLRQRKYGRPALLHPLVQFAALPAHFQWSWRIVVRESLLALVMVALILAMARPRWPDPQARLPARALAWVLVVDISGSMAEYDYVPESKKLTRWDVAKQVLRKLLAGDDQEFAGRRDDLIGLVTFAVFVQDLAPPTANHGAILELLDRSTPISTPPESATNIGDALILALHLLEGSAAPSRRILLLSDGEHNVPEEILAGARHPVEAAQLARSLQIPIDTIRIGPAPETLAEPRLRRDAEIGQQIMRQVASMTGGIALDAPDAEKLRFMLAEWDKLTRPVVERPEYYHYREAYPWLGGLALLMLTAAILWEWKLAMRVP